MEDVERTNVVIVCSYQRVGFVQCNLYAIDIDRGNRNCYSCQEFRHIARNCKNRETGNKIGKRRKLEYRKRRMIEGRNGQSSNLNGEGDLIIFN